MADDPYFTMADLPDSARTEILRLANILDRDGDEIVRASEHRTQQELPDGLDRDLPIGPSTRFGAAVEWLDRLAHTGVDPVPVLERLWQVAEADAGGSLTDTEDVLRALNRETALVRANDREKEGRPSKVEPHAEAILWRAESVAEADSPEDRDRRARALRQDVADAEVDLSRRSWYRLRRRVLDSGGPDINEFDVRKNLD